MSRTKATPLTTRLAPPSWLGGSALSVAAGSRPLSHAQTGDWYATGRNTLLCMSIQCLVLQQLSQGVMFRHLQQTCLDVKVGLQNKCLLYLLFQIFYRYFLGTSFSMCCLGTHARACVTMLLKHMSCCVLMLMWACCLQVKEMSHGLVQSSSERAATWCCDMLTWQAVAALPWPD